VSPEERPEAMEAKAGRLGRAFAILDQAVFILDRSTWTIVDANRAAERTFAGDRETLRGSPMRELHADPKAFESFRSESERALASGAEYRAEGLMRRADGSTFESEQSLCTLAPDVGSGSGSRLLCAVRDVSVRKDLERRLLHAEKMEAVGRLAGSVAHDFNNLVMVIRANMELMAADPDLAPRFREYADEILAASRRAAYLSRHLLAFSRSRSFEPRPVDLNRVLEEISRLVARLIGEDVTLELDLAPSLPPVEVDPGQIEQAVMNLAANARDAMPGGGRLVISTATARLGEGDRARFPGVGPGPHVLLRVRDTGAGMAPEVRERALDPFFTTKGGKGGTGLGLASVQGVVARCGGGVALESEQGEGTTVVLCFPVTEAVPERAAERPPADLGASGGETVLLVEDDPAVRRVMERILTRAGYVVLTAETAEDALSIAFGRTHDDGVDLLLTDLILPRATGFELIQSLRARKPALKVLVMSGYLGDRIPDERIRELELPFLSKPFTPETLVARVREILTLDRDS
jgi:two-component system, cell cycle sensor histidine kinase and response regulator CckA